MKSSEKFWNTVAGYAKPEVGKTGQQIIDLSTPFLKHNHQVLDFGCGNGALAIELSKIVEQVTAIDPSEGMINIAQTKVLEDNIRNINLLKTGIFDAQLNHQKFDVIFALNVLQYLKEPKDYLDRIYHLLTPNGLFISSTACLGEKKSLITLLVKSLSKVGIMLTFASYSKEQLLQHMLATNFTVLQQAAISKIPELFVVARKLG